MPVPNIVSPASSWKGLEEFWSISLGINRCPQNGKQIRSALGDNFKLILHQIQRELANKNRRYPTNRATRNYNLDPKLLKIWLDLFWNPGRGTVRHHSDSIDDDGTGYTGRPSRSTAMPRAMTCGLAKTWSNSLIGPAGIPACSSCLKSSSRPHCAVITSIASIKSTRLRIR